MPRYIEEFVMGQLETEQALGELRDQTTRTLVRVLIETGLRSVDAMRLPLDPVTCDQAGAPYLRFYNHKASRDAIIPISDRARQAICRYGVPVVVVGAATHQGGCRRKAWRR
jgi:site-specific recombinase XerD